MEAAREFLEHLASHDEVAPDGCAHFEVLIWEHRALGRMLQSDAIVAK